MTRLEEAIAAAHVRGDRGELAKLQAEYRATAAVTSAGRGGAVQPTRLVEKPRPRRSAAAASARKVELRDRWPQFEFEVRLGNTRTTIEDEVGSVHWRFGQSVETGGWLYSLYRPRVRDVLLCHVSDPGPNSKHSPRRVQLSSAEEVAAEFDEVQERAGMLCVGDFHTHPDQDPRPSEVDLQAWAGSLERSGLLVWTGLIVTPSRDLGWSVPTITGWQTHRIYDGGHVCEPARLID